LHVFLEFHHGIKSICIIMTIHILDVNIVVSGKWTTELYNSYSVFNINTGAIVNLGHLDCYRLRVEVPCSVISRSVAEVSSTKGLNFFISQAMPKLNNFWVVLIDTVDRHFFQGRA